MSLSVELWTSIGKSSSKISAMLAAIALSASVSVYFEGVKSIGINEKTLSLIVNKQ